MNDEIGKSSIQVKFITKEAEIAVDALPLLVPTSLRRYGLSEVINHLLETDSPIPFDFLLDGQVLRTSLQEYLASKALSTETTLTIEYVRSILPPTPRASFLHDDWVSGVSLKTQIALTSSYDGGIRIWNNEGAVVAMTMGHIAAAKDVQWTSDSQFLSCGMDCSVKMWEWNGKKRLRLIAELNGHEASVEKLAVNSSSQLALSASSDGKAKLWRTNLENASSETEPPSKKRKADVFQVNAMDFNGHVGPCQACTFDPVNSQAAYTVGLDSTIRTWDLVVGDLVNTRTTQNPLLSLLYLRELHLLACGTSAGHITLHDPRSSANAISTQTLNGHRGFVVDLTASPANGHMIASASHDGVTRIWDVRAAASVYMLKRQSGEGNCKVLGVDWNSEMGIASAGTDKVLQINSFVS
jgi:ribosome biogenesis protein YTM1